MNNKNNVATGKPKVGGAVFRAPLGSTMPTDATTALDAAFIPLGYVSEDGLKNNTSISADKVKAWGGDIVLIKQTEKEDTFNFALIESTNPEVLKAVHGDSNVTVNQNSITVSVNNTQADASIYVFETIMRNKIKRMVVPEGYITSIDEISYKDDDVVGYGITITAVADGDGNTHYEYISA